MDDNDFVIMDALFAEVKRLNADLQEEDTEVKPDSKCREDDGCPTENAVLRREWRKLTEQLAAVTAERDAAVETMSNLLKHSDDDICAYCKNRVECKEKECDCYEHGKGVVDMDGNEHPDLEWTCEDFDYGTCQKMKGTKCEKCFENGYSGFEWVGIGKEQNDG